MTFFHIERIHKACKHTLLYNKIGGVFPEDSLHKRSRLQTETNIIGINATVEIKLIVRSVSSNRYSLSVKS